MLSFDFVPAVVLCKIILLSYCWMFTSRNWCSQLWRDTLIFYVITSLWKLRLKQTVGIWVFSVFWKPLTLTLQLQVAPVLHLFAVRLLWEMGVFFLFCFFKCQFPFLPSYTRGHVNSFQGEEKDSCFVLIFELFFLN